ncbi:MAG: LPS export ABC transporter periplasmic protein LptC [Deltaproteobacteria bacterium]|nr:LPS export ABC transporter periplasmic protein LptC [Deltaproteobacteria bacterium]
MKKLLLITAGVILAAIAVLLLYLQQVKKNPQQLLPTIAKHLEFELNGAHYTHSKKGRKRWELTAAKAQKEKGSDDITLFKIVVNLYADDGSKTVVTADKGVYNTKSGDITLLNRVRISNPDYTISTDELVYRDREEQVNINRPITIKYAQLTLKASRATMLIPAKTINFSGGVTAVIAPREKDSP